MSRLTGMFGALFGYFCIGTVLAQVLVVGYLWNQGRLDKGKVVEMLAVAHGLDLTPEKNVDELIAEGGGEQGSLKEIQITKAEMSRDLDLRQQLLENTKVELARIQANLLNETERFAVIREAFFDALRKVEQEAKTDTERPIRDILRIAKPKLAKSQLITMWANDERKRVVSLLGGMPDGTLKKIIAEFKDENDNETLAEILREISKADPRSQITQEARAQLGQNDGVERQ